MSVSGSETRRRSRSASFRCTEQELADIDAAAAMAGKRSVAEFIREATMARVVEVGMRAAGDGLVTDGLVERARSALPWPTVASDEVAKSEVAAAVLR